jgi:hypothetical protein
MNSEISDSKEDDGEAGDEHGHGGECSKVTKEIGHCGSLSFYVSNLFYFCSHVNGFSPALWTRLRQRNKVASTNGGIKMKSLIAALMLSAALPALSAAADFPADRIIAMASGDWNKDGTPDLAVVAMPGDDSGDDNGLYVYVAKPEENRLTLALSLPNTVWGNLTMYGQEPELAALGNGSFTLTTKNDSIGRERWRETLTIAYRNFDFIVAGYTYSAYDTIAEDGGENRTSDCDLNVLTGKGKRDGQAVADKAQFVLLKDWNNSIPRSVCGLGN